MDKNSYLCADFCVKMQSFRTKRKKIINVKGKKITI